MKAKTLVGRRLKRLANDFANACVDLSWLGCTHPEEHDEIRQRHRKARRRLHAAIDELTSMDITPRTVDEEY